MPPHGRVAFAVNNAEGVYAYFRERENGTIPARTFVCE